MKKTLPLILFMTYGVAVNAAPLYKNEISQHRAICNAILQKQAGTGPAYKTTGIQKRLIANSYTGNGILTDSNHYYYSNGRGSSHSNAESYYDNFYATGVNSTTKNILDDSSINWHLTSGGNLIKTVRETYAYNTDNKVINHDHLTTYYHLGHAITYTSQGNINTVIASDTEGGTAFIPKSTFYAAYNSQGKRISDSTVDLSSGLCTYKRIYTLDANGNMLKFEAYQYISSVWTKSYRNINTYDLSNRLITSTAEYDFTGMGLENYSKDSFAYNGSSPNAVYHITFGWDNLTMDWEKGDCTLYQYNSQGLLDTYYLMNFSSQWDTVERDVHTYDSNNLLLRTNGYVYLGNGVFDTNPYDQSNMYYEDYFPTGINTVVTGDNISIYPNPSKGIINIHTDDNKTGNVSIFNLSGQLILNSSGKQLNKQLIDMQQYPSGNYIIHIADDSGKQLYQQQLSKL